MRKLSRDQLTVLFVANTHGEVRASTRIALDACIALAAYGYLNEHDNAPGTYYITASGADLAEALAPTA